jgi:hypothetical protein
MDTIKVKDLMVPLDEYAVVPEEATLLDAINALESAQKRLPEGRQPHRAVLVEGKDKKIIGKVGQLAFLKALEPKYNVLGDLEMLARAGVQPDFISSMMENYQFFQDSLSDLCWRGRNIRVTDVMRPVAEHIDEKASLREAIHQIIMLQTLSILVTRGREVIGLLRLSDLYEEVADQMKNAPSDCE